VGIASAPFNGVINLVNSIPNLVVNSLGTLTQPIADYQGEIFSAETGLGPAGPEAMFLTAGIANLSFLIRAEAAVNAAKGLSRGIENVATFKGLNEARASARQLSGLEDDAVNFVQKIGPIKGQVTGRMSPDGLRGWRIDFDSSKGFHVNWWDRTAGPKRAAWLYGANSIEGGTLDQFWQTLQHFPKN
jgi:hypothetical protein